MLGSILALLAVLGAEIGVGAHAAAVLPLPVPSQVDSRNTDALTAQQEVQQHRRGRALLATAAATGALFDLVESKDSVRKDAQQAGSHSDSGQQFQNRWQRREAVQRTLRELKKHEERLIGKNKPRKQDVHYQAIVHDADPASDAEDENGTAPERVPAEVRQLSRQNAFKDGRRQEKLVEKAREAYDATGGGLAGMQEAGRIVTNRDSPVPRASVGEVFVMTFIMAAVSGLGAVPFFFVGMLSKEWSAMANAIACGVMLAASFDLVHEAQPYGAGLAILGVVLGAMFIRASQEWLEQFENVRFEGLQGANAQKTLLVVAVMAAHALGEGSGVGVSFCGHRGWVQGVLVTLAIGLHNIPEGLAVATVLVARGVSPKQAFWWSIATSMPQPLVAVPSFVFVTAFRALLPVALGFAAGCMVWMVFAELLPDALEDAAHGKIATAATFSAASLEAVRMLLASLERPDGSLASPIRGDLSVALPTVALLLPAIIPAAAAGGLLASAMAPGPALLGAAAGFMVWDGAGGLLSSVTGGGGLGWTLGGAAAGAGSAWSLWRMQLRSLRREQKHDKKSEKSSGDVESLRLANGHAHEHAHTNGEHWIPVAGALISPSVSPRGHHMGVHTRGSPFGSALDLQAPDGRSQRLHLPPYLQQKPPGSPPESLHGSLPDRPLQPGPSFGYLLNGYHSGSDAGDKRVGGGRGRARRKHVPWPAWSTQSLAAALAAGALAVDGIPAGWAIAQSAVVSVADAGTALLPACLIAAAKGTAAAALAAPVIGHTPRRLAGLALAVGSVAPLTAAFSVLGFPVGLEDGNTGEFDAQHWIPKVSSMTAGAVLFAGVCLVYPLASRLRLRSANIGLALGLFLAASVAAVRGLLCLTTPFCLGLLAD